MNKKQRLIIIVGVFMVVAMILFPPWVGSAYRSGKYPAGYGLLFSPPPNVTNVDTNRLLLQILGAAVLVGGLCVFVKDSKSR